jgi:hypothetical protein
MRVPLILGGCLFATGMTLYAFLPDTMLQRSIDLKWYSIMVAQLGLFILLILLSIRIFDRPRARTAHGWLFRFIRRFGYAGLTAFFLESVVAAIIWRVLKALIPDLRLEIGGALLFGFILALLWGFLLIAWEKCFYIGSIEYFYTLFVTRFGLFSSKALKLGGEKHESAAQPD